MICRFLYYDRYGRWDKPLSGRVGHFGDVSERRELRQRLQCRSFQWWGELSYTTLTFNIIFFLFTDISGSFYMLSLKRYLDNVAVEMPQHKLLGSGEIFNLAAKQCLDQSDKVNDGERW